MTCACCGVELVSGGPSLKGGTPVIGSIQADQPGMEYVYRDAGGLLITSFEPLACPIFIGNKPGNVAGAIMMDRVSIRALSGAMHTVQYRMEGLEERVARLERDNAVLREAISQPINADAVVNFLADMVAAAARAKLESVPVLIEGTRYALPEPMARVIIDVASQSEEREFVFVRQRVKEKEKERGTP